MTTQGFIGNSMAALCVVSTDQHSACVSFSAYKVFIFKHHQCLYVALASFRQGSFMVMLTLTKKRSVLFLFSVSRVY